MKVSDLLLARVEVYSVADTATVFDAARYLREKQVRAVGVLNAEGKLVGVLSQSDISDKVAAENVCPAWTRVAEVMSRQLVLVAPDTPLDACVRLMDKHGLYHLGVVDAEGRFRGLISVRDLLQIIASDEKARADLLEQYLFPPR